jgi:chromosome segregation ATPase
MRKFAHSITRRRKKRHNHHPSNNNDDIQCMDDASSSSYLTNNTSSYKVDSFGVVMVPNNSNNNKIDNGHSDGTTLVANTESTTNSTIMDTTTIEYTTPIEGRSSGPISVDSPGNSQYNNSHSSLSNPNTSTDNLSRKSGPISVDSPPSSSSSSSSSSRSLVENHEIQNICDNNHHSKTSDLQNSYEWTVDPHDSESHNDRVPQITEFQQEIQSLRSQLHKTHSVVQEILQVDSLEPRLYKSALECVMNLNNSSETRNKGKTNSHDSQETHSDEHNDIEQSKHTETMQSLQSQIEALQHTLKQKQEELDTPHRDDIQQEADIKGIQRDLTDARIEIEDLERERELQKTQIAMLTSQLRQTPKYQTSTADSQDLEEARDRIEKLERESWMRVRKEKELRQLLEQYKEKLGKYQDCDSGVDYVQRVITLENQVQAAERQRLLDVTAKVEEIEVIKTNSQQELWSQGAKWERKFQKSASQIRKLERRLEEAQTYIQEMEKDNQALSQQLEDAETKIAEIEDSSWMRDQKLAGITTMYQKTSEMLKELQVKYDTLSSTAVAKIETSSSLGNDDDSLLSKSDRKTNGVAKPTKGVFREYEAKNKELRQKLKHSMKLCQEHEITIADLSKKLKLLKDANDRKRNEESLNSKPQASDSSKEKNSDMKLKTSEKMRFTNQIGNLTRENADLKKKLVKLEKQTNQIQQKNSIEGMDAANGSSLPGVPVNEWKITSQKLKEALETLESERKAHREDITRLTKELDESRNRITEQETRTQGTIPDDVQQQLDAKTEEIQQMRKNHAGVEEQLGLLRSHLTETMTKLEQLEHERNFSEAKIMELRTMNVARIGSDEEKLNHLLIEKAVRCAELETKLSQVEKSLSERTKKIECLQAEYASNQATMTAELIALRECQVSDDKAKKAVIGKAMEVAEQLNDALQRMEELEDEKEKSLTRAATLEIQLALCTQTIQDLTNQLRIAQCEVSRLESQSLESTPHKKSASCTT